MKHAFTLIELLVVIAIIAILSTLSIVAFSNTRLKSRDARRLSDVRTIRTALEMYYNTEGHYPAAITIGQSVTNTANEVLLSKIPSNPRPRTDNGCPDNDYVYATSTDLSSYTLTFCLGNTSGSMAGGSWIANTNGYVATNTPSGGDGGFTCGQTFTDSRDSNIYPTVSINNQCWMAKNLAFLPQVSGMSYGSAYAYFVYNYMGSDVAAAKLTPEYINYGVLYNWNAATSSCPTSSGWHLPTKAEWDTLVTFLGSSGGTKLKASSTNTPIAWNGDNSLGFTVLPSGDANFHRSYNGGPWLFGGIGTLTGFWTTTLSSPGWISTKDFSTANATIGNGVAEAAYGLPVRCIHD